MRRRELITGIAACGAGTLARAQSPGRMYRIGYLGNTAANTPQDERVVAALVQRLRELGFIDPMYVSERLRLQELLAATRLTVACGHRENMVAGGLLSYTSNYPANFRYAAKFVDKILRGAKPADLPVEQPTKFELVINLKTAKALGITVPQTVLLRADEVIQ
jgi:ABC-type uncharacterized transport system substrate-binding protein